MKEKLSYLSKNILLFALNGFLPKVLAFLLIPIYTGYLTTAEYGVSDLITTTVQMLLPVFTLTIHDAVIRFAMDKEYDAKAVFSSAIRITLVGIVFVTLGAFGVSLLNVEGIQNSYLLFLVLMYAITALDNSVTRFCKGIDQVKAVVVGSLLHSAITMGCNVLFLVVFRWGLNGYLVANTLGAAAALIYEFFAAKLYRYLQWKPALDVSRAMRRYSFPMIFSALAWWVNNASDRYVLTFIAGVGISGIYAVAYKIPNLLSVFQNVFSQAWSISAIKEFDPKDSDGFMGKTYSALSFSMMLVCSLIMLADVPLARILYSNDFFAAWQFVPPLLISIVLNAMSLFLGSIFMAAKDTKKLSICTIIGAVVNTALNFTLIPVWGAYGAAIATVTGYAVDFAMRHLFLRKHMTMRIRWGRDLAAYGALLTQMVLAYFGWKTVLFQCVCTLALLLLFRKEIRSVAGSVKSWLRKKQKSEKKGA